MTGWDGMYGGSMMWGGWLIWLLVCIALVLGTAALIKYLRSRVVASFATDVAPKGCLTLRAGRSHVEFIALGKHVRIWRRTSRDDM